VRGGGATSDLAAFDDEAVARAIATCRHPVISGVGHEQDTSVADEVAAMVGRTPTGAAQLLVDRVAFVWQRIDRLSRNISNAALLITNREARRLDDHHRRLTIVAQTAISAERTRLHLVDARLATAVDRALDRRRTDLDQRTARVSVAGARAVVRETSRLDLAETQIRLLDPAHTLARGWSITRRADGTVLRSIADAHPRDALITTVADGQIHSTVTPSPEEPAP
jgi:exodeoxyribonuclease VII large subunit